MLFLGAAIAITAFPMLARIISERGLSGTPLGTLALAAGAIDDATAWCVLAVVLASFGGGPMVAITAIVGGAAYAVLMLTVGRKLSRARPATERAGGLRRRILAMVLMLVMLAAWLTDIIGMHAVFGGFILGIAMPRGRVRPGIAAQARTLRRGVPAADVLHLLRPQHAARHGEPWRSC